MPQPKPEPSKQAFSADGLLVSTTGEVMGRPSPSAILGSRNALPAIEHFAMLIQEQPDGFVEHFRLEEGEPIKVTWISRGDGGGIATFSFQEPKLFDTAVLLNRESKEGDAVVAEWFWKSVRETYLEGDFVSAMAASEAILGPLSVVVSPLNVAARPSHVDFIELCFAAGYFFLRSMQREDGGENRRDEPDVPVPLDPVLPSKYRSKKSAASQADVGKGMLFSEPELLEKGRTMHPAIYEELKRVARSQKTTTYGQIAHLADLDMGRADHRAKMSAILDEISRHEHSLGRPLLSAVVVQSDGAGNGTIPGPGFFTMAKDVGLQGKLDNVTFFARELTRVHEVWRTESAGK